ncbi:MAG: HlyD family efflux transporter periplasmic adaptor subunit [Planctomycetota bacterium]
MTDSLKSNLSGLVLGWLLPLAIAAAGVFVFLSLGKQTPKQVGSDPSDPREILTKMPMVNIDTTRDFRGIETLDIDLSGTVVPFRQVTIAAEVPGRVVFKSDLCRIGRYVNRGDLLFKLNPKDYELEIERITALKESEYAQQRELEQEISNIKRSLALADEELALQEKELARLASLPEGIASETERDQSKRQRIVSANQVVTFQNQLQLLQTRRTRIELAERLADTQLAQANVNLDRSEIKSPIAGVIVNETVQEDSYVQRADKLCIIEDTERVEVSCNLRTDQLLLILDQINEGGIKDPSSQVLRASSYELPATPVEISYQVAGRSDVVYQWHGKLSRYEGIGLDTQSRTVPVRITVENPRDVRRNGIAITEEGNGGLPALVRGMFVDVKIQTKPRRSLVLIPKLALKPGGQVWAFEPEATDTQNQASKGTVATDLNLSDPADWLVGKVKIVTGIQTIRLSKVPHLGDREYWIAEASEGIPTGSKLITSPLANLIGDGSDKARTAKSTMANEGINP